MRNINPTVIAVAAALAVAGADAATINLIDQGGIAGSPAEHALKVAAGWWAGMLTNDVTINVGVGFESQGPGLIGWVATNDMDYATADWKSGFNATKSLSTIDQTLELPTLTGGGFSGLTTGVNETGNNDISVPAVEVNGKEASKTLFLTTANVKAVGGLVPKPDELDALIMFSSDSSFDYNPSNGIAAGHLDFIGGAIHQIGHALGFVSGVDFFDIYGYPDGPGAGYVGYDLNDTSVFSALDMFRYGKPGQIDLTVGGTKYFSIDGGEKALFGNEFSTGEFQGDGVAAWHWKKPAECDKQLGIMFSPCAGYMAFITGLDLAAFDAIGWNLNVDALQFAGISTADIYLAAVPEPSTWALMFAGLGLMRLARRAKPG